MGYAFFYDEAEHSRKINYKTITANNYYDNFITAIVGWDIDKEEKIIEKYLNFEEKYAYRKKNGELKSQTININDFRLGFSSLSCNRISFYEDLISLFDEDIILYFSVSSKIEYIINQILINYHSSMSVNVNYMTYSIVKAINIYKPLNLIKALYIEPSVFINELRFFLKERIEKNTKNITLKSGENIAFGEILNIIDDVETPETFDWSYLAPFDGFKKMLEEMGVDDYRIMIDREGDNSLTLKSACYVGLMNVEEGDSKNTVGIRMADMMAGMISRFMHSIGSALKNDYADGNITKTLLDSGWFELNPRQLDLYKKFYKVICENNNYWYKVYSGAYSDDLVAFIAFLTFMNHFNSIDEIRFNGIDRQPEYYNSFACKLLQEHYRLMDTNI